MIDLGRLGESRGDMSSWIREFRHDRSFSLVELHKARPFPDVGKEEALLVPHLWPGLSANIDANANANANNCFLPPPPANHSST